MLMASAKFTQKLSAFLITGGKDYAVNAGIVMILIIVLALVFRMSGVFLSLLGTNLNRKERLFCMIAYTPKATVQAAIGTIPLSMGLACGNIVLTAAVVSLLFTAPFGAICVDNSYKKIAMIRFVAVL